MPSVIQRSFAGGVISPALHGRADVAKYAIGCKTLRNFIVRREGSVENRPGTEYIEQCFNVGERNRLVPFIYNPDTSSSYFIEWNSGDFCIWSNGARLQTSPVAWVTSTAYEAGDIVSNGGSTYYCRAPHTSGATTEPGVGADQATYWYATFGTLLTIPHPYSFDDLPALRWAQANDILTITHPNHPPYELRRRSASLFAFVKVDFRPSLTGPTGVSLSGSAGAVTSEYIVTAVSETGEESLAGTGSAAAATITGVSVSVYVVFGVPFAEITVTTSGAHGFSVGDFVNIDGVVGAIEINGKAWRVNATPSATTFRTNSYAGTVFGALGGSVAASPGGAISGYVSGGTATRISSRAALAAPSTGTPITVSWTASSFAAYYRVYRNLNGLFGFVGTASGNSFVDTGYTPDVLDVPPIDNKPFSGAGNFPACVGYYQQRRVFGSTTNAPQTVWASAIYSGANLTRRIPSKDDDAVSFAINGRLVQPVRHLLDMDRLVILTAGAVFTAEGNESGTLTPTAINLRQRSYDGASTLQPIQIGQAALYVQARGSIVRDLVIDSASGFVARDLTIFSSHLFDDHEIVDWAYQQVPHSIVWAVRDDGVLLSLTYVREHDVWAWAEHETEGTVESICVVPEGAEDALYLQTVRQLFGTERRAIERMASRSFDDIAEALFLDCATWVDGTNLTATTLTLSGGTAWTFDEELTLTASASTFGAAWVGNEVHLTIAGETLRCRVVGYTSPTVVTVLPQRTVPAAFQGVATASWAYASATFTTEHQSTTVGILADGHAYSTTTDDVGGGTLPVPAVKFWVGLPYTSDLELLDIEDPQGQTLTDKKKRMNGVTVLVQDSRGMFAGPDEDSLWEWPQREGSDDPELFTGPVEIGLTGRWKDDGRVLIRQTDPLPLRILGVVRRLVVS